MVKVAITGGPGSGKSMVLSFFERKGALVVDLDVLARQVVAPGSPAYGAIVDRFGDHVVSSDGTLDRKQLRRTILLDSESRKALEKIVHPAIRSLLREKLTQIEKRFPDAIVAVEVPLLVETGMQEEFDVVVLVDADPSTRKKRIVKRDRCSEQEAEALMDLHLSSEAKGRGAQYIVRNTGMPDDAKVTVERILDKISSKTLTS